MRNEQGRTLRHVEESQATLKRDIEHNVRLIEQSEEMLERSRERIEKTGNDE